MKKTIAVNLGSTSTKVAYYEDGKMLLNKTLSHAVEDVKHFSTIWEQQEYRKQALLEFMQANNIDVNQIDAFISRGGQSEPVESGIYRINEKMLDQAKSMKYGNHVSSVGLFIAHELAQEYGVEALIVDSENTDEFSDLARYSGHPKIKRKSSMHILSHKAVARKYCVENGLNYSDVNLIVVHMGGGISVAAHEKGRIVDANNALDGDGPFSTNRTGGLPVTSLVELCYSGEYTLTEMKTFINGQGGLMAYVGNNDVLTVYNQAQAGDKVAQEALEAMIYQVAKEIGFVAPVLNGEVAQIIVTGGIAYNDYIISEIKKRVNFIANMTVYPGEFEMESLGKQSYLALIGEETIKEL